MKKMTLLAMLASGVLAISAAQANTNISANADGRIKFRGKVVDQTCAVKTDKKDLIVTLPTVSKSKLNADSAVAGTTAFAIDLENCKSTSESGVSTVKLFFLPGADLTVYDIANKALKNKAQANTDGVGAAVAGNVGIQILDSQGTLIPIGQDINTYSHNTDRVALGSATPNNVTLNYKAQYIALGAAAEVGDVRATVEYNIVYD